MNVTPATARRDTWTSLGAFCRTLFAMLGRRVLVALLLSAALGLTEGAGFLLLIPMLTAVGVDTGSGSVGMLASAISRAFSALHLTPSLVTALFAYAAVITVQTTVSRWQVITVLSVELHFVAGIRKRLYAAVARARWQYLARSRASNIAQVLTNEADRVGIATYQVLQLIVHLCVSTVYLALALRLSATLTIGVMLTGGAVLIALQRRIGASRRQGERTSKATEHLFTAAVEHVAALRIAKSYGAEERHVASLAAVADTVADTQIEAIRISAGSRSWFEVGGVMALSLLLWIGLRVLQLPAGAVMLLLYVYSRIMPRLSAFQQALQDVAYYLPAFAATERLRIEAEREAEPVRDGADPVIFRRHIRLDHVTFVHDEGGGGVREITVDIPFGSTAAILGPSGAGKSTLADLLCGLYRPQRGTMTVDDTAIDDRHLSGWKAQIGYVNQDTFLFNTSVRANLLWACPDATDDGIRDALSLAAAEFVLDLPGGLDAELGDRGQRLSGGERQRLALARALLRKPKLLLLDEATSALDAANEQRILDAIRRLHGTMTVVLITHRTSAARDADTIYLLEDGHLAASGTWTTLADRLGNPVNALIPAHEV
ncbi:MAG: ABC transporter ATP-binding protein/permease [Acidobacteriaceae bacterium]|nr:ABC transporter ATP-binding protein/permease [Acidobacteriaceae bacterium]